MTLIDLVIALMVIGLLAAPIIGTLKRKSVTDPRNYSEININSTRKAIEDFFFEHDRYPCPADPTLSPDNPDYGYENCTGTDWAGDTTDGVLEGAVPFSTLKIPPEASLDGWSSKLLYAVALAQCDESAVVPTAPVTFASDPATFETSGQIAVNQLNQDYLHPDSGLPVCPDPSIPGIQPSDLNPPTIQKQHFIILSHGANAVGAYTPEGVLIEACDTTPTAPPEAENCNGDAVFRLQSCVENLNDPDLYYDDFAPSVASSTPRRIWENPDVATENTATRTALVGLGVKNPLFEVDVAGNVKAEGNEAENPDQKGNAHAGSLCTGDLSNENQPTTCFSPSLITGNEPDMNCNNTANAMTGIAKNKTLCGITYFTGNEMTCEDGKYMAGINNGQPVCRDPP